MLYKTRGIVLNYIKYRETSVVAKIYTKDFGIQSYIINGIRSHKSKKGLALLQPLTLLDLVVYHSKRHDALQRISEFKPSFTFQSIPFNIKKSTMALFITELLSKVLKNEEEQGHVFEYLDQIIQYLDSKSENFENLHLQLMVQLTRFIGFGIPGRKELEQDNILQKVNTSFDEIFDMTILLNNSEIANELIISNKLRQDVLTYIINYYCQHVEGFKEMKSMEVLSKIFH